MTFVLHERLAADTVPVTRLPLCDALLMNDARFPWVILVPRVPGARDIIDLPDADIVRLQAESVAVQRALRALFTPDKLNVAAIGNLVPQLHLHHVARHTGDSEWPAPVWGRGTPLAYEAAVRARRVADLQERIARELAGATAR